MANTDLNERNKFNDESQYLEIYFPKTLLHKKREAQNLLLDIDCNFSKLIQMFLNSIIELAPIIKKEGKNFRHYNWFIRIELKKNGNTINKKKGV